MALGCAYRAAAAPETALPNPFEAAEYAIKATPLDECVLASLRKLGIKPAAPCSDAVFLRRACLDVTGTMPTSREANDFILSKNPRKREELIDRLLGGGDFVDYWTLKWCDVLRVKAEFPINLWPNAAQAYHRWIHDAVGQNLPYDQFARELLTASGSNFRVPPVNFYRAMQNREPQGTAQTVALTFMGSRTDRWPEERLKGLAAFFARIGTKETSEWKEEIIFFDPAISNAWTGVSGRFPDGTTARLTGDRDPRQVFADWLVSPQNPWFTRAIANRTWAWLFGRGIVHETDDLRPDNPPANPELLAYLERELAGSRYDLRHLLRLILNSRTYQQAAAPAAPHPEATAQFAHYPIRRVEAEVLIDALNQITGGTEKYTSAIPEPFTYMPEGYRAVCLPDGSISSSFLELFGKPARDTGMEAERNNRVTSAQRLHLLNSTHIQRKLEQGGNLQAFIKSGGGYRQLVSGLYLAILSRFPTEQEIQTALDHAQSGGSLKKEAALDLAWALINSAEFLFRH